MTPTSRKGGAGIRLHGLRFSYRDSAAMHFDLAVDAGEIAAIMGPSGAGKSTLLNLIAGFASPDQGKVLIGGEDVTAMPPHRRPVSMVFQENNLFGHLTVAQNVGLGRSPSLRLSAEDREAVADALARTGLSGREARLPNALSGGERQRVALARVLVRRRPVLLLDEPFASLGPALRDEMLDLVAELHQIRAMTILMVTHEPRDAEKLAKRLIFLDEGRIAASGSVRDLKDGVGSPALSRYLGRRKLR